MSARASVLLAVVVVAVGIAAAELIMMTSDTAPQSAETAAAPARKAPPKPPRPEPPRPDQGPLRLPPGVYVERVVLQRVSNASGLAAVTINGRPAYATVDEVPSWEGDGPAPPLIVHSERGTGTMLGGTGAVGSFGEIEALAERDGRIVFPYKTGAQTVVLRDGVRDIPVVGPALIADLKTRMSSIEKPPFFFEFEGLAWHDGGWELLCAAVRPDAADTPRSTMALFRIRTRADGTGPLVAGPIRWKDGRRYTDYGAALDITPEGLAIVPGFHRRGAVLVDRDGVIVHEIDLPTSRVEGVRWFPETQTMWLARECAGLGTACADGVVFGTPLWDVHFRKGLFAK